MAGIPAPDLHADHLAARSPEHAAEGVASLDDGAVGIGDVNAVAGILQQDAAAFVGTVVRGDQPVEEPGRQPGHTEEEHPQQHRLADVLPPLGEVVLLAPADDHEGRQALEPAVGVDPRHAIGRSGAVEGLRADLGGDDLAQLEGAAAPADHPGRGIETRPARDQGHVEVPHQRDPVRPELQAREQALEVIGRHGCGDDAGEVALGRVVAAREHDDPGVGDAPVQQLARPGLAVVQLTMIAKERTVGIARARLGGDPVAEHNGSRGVAHAHLGRLRQPVPMQDDRRVEIVALQPALFAQLALDPKLDPAQHQIDLAHRGADALVEQQGQVLDRGAHLVFLAGLRLQHRIAQQSRDEQVKRQHRGDQSPEDLPAVVLHVSA